MTCVHIYIYIIRFILQMRGFIDQFSIMFSDVNMYPDVMPTPFSVPLSVPLVWYVAGTDGRVSHTCLTQI